MGLIMKAVCVVCEVGRVMAEALSRRRVTADTQVHCQFCVWQIGTKAGFSLTTLVFRLLVFLC